MSVRCCGQDSIWVDNVPGKEYYYCRECKKEVSPDAVSPIETVGEQLPFWKLPESYSVIYSDLGFHFHNEEDDES
jgi:hypothetical protein